MQRSTVHPDHIVKRSSHSSFADPQVTDPKNVTEAFAGRSPPPRQGDSVHTGSASRSAASLVQSAASGAAPKPAASLLRRLTKTLLPALLCLTAPMAFADNAAGEPAAQHSTIPAPSPYQASYQARSHGLSATGYRELNLTEDGVYELSQGTSVRVLGARLGSVRESSRFVWADDSIVPLSYRYRQSGISRRSESLSFDWESGVAEADEDSERSEVPLEAGMLDKLSFTAQLSVDIQRAQLAGEGQKDFFYEIVDGNDVLSYHLRIVGEENMKTPIGEIPTTKVQRVRDPDSERSTIFWLAQDKEYLLVRLENISGSGARSELMLESLRLQSPPHSHASVGR